MTASGAVDEKVNSKRYKCHRWELYNPNERKTPESRSSKVVFKQKEKGEVKLAAGTAAVMKKKVMAIRVDTLPDRAALGYRGATRSGMASCSAEEYR